MGTCNFKQPPLKEDDKPTRRPRCRSSHANYGFFYELLDRDLTRNCEAQGISGEVEALSASKKWRKKYLKIHNNVLMYGCAKTRICTGVIPLYEAEVMKTSAVEFVGVSNRTRYTFRCESEAKCDEWVEALTSAVLYSVEDHYDIQEVLGKGSYATVHKARNIKTNEIRAIKIFEKRNTNLKPHSIRNEVTTLRNCHHKNIIKFYDVIEDLDRIYVVTELAKGKELFEHIQQNCLIESNVKQIVRSCLHALECLHSSNFIHGDLKPENILYDESTGVVKLVDLGSSKPFHTDDACRLSPNDSFTLTYLAPEMINNESHGTGIDMWSLGVTAYVLLCRQVPFRGDCENELYDQITEIDFDFSPEAFKTISQEAQNFISRLLCRESSRMSASEALQHAWIAQQETN